MSNLKALFQFLFATLTLRGILSSLIFSTTIKLIYVNVPDGKLQNGDSCSNNECSIGMSICIDRLDSKMPTDCYDDSFYSLGALTKSQNSLTFSNTTYGSWSNPQYVSFTTSDPDTSGFVFKCNIYDQTYSTSLPIDQFAIRLTYDNQSFINFYGRRINNDEPTNIQFWWDNPYAPIQLTTTAFTCMNGGSVIESNTCSCTPQFTGLVCETIICENNGTSVGSTCRCRSLYTGEFCEIFAPGNCWDIYTDGSDTSDGVKTIYMNGNLSLPLIVYCEAGWTTVQRQINANEAFAQTWLEYENGFGDLSTNAENINLWIGNRNLHLLTATPNVPMAIQFVFKSCSANGTIGSLYSNIKVGGADTNYTFTSSGFVDLGGGDGAQYFNGSSFSTFDNDKSSCASKYDNSGFWFDVEQCSTLLVPNLNGILPMDNYTCYNEVGYSGVLWTPLTGEGGITHQSLDYSKILLVPTSALSILFN